MSELRAQASPAASPERITVGRTAMFLPDEREVTLFTLTLEGETISLLPLRNWSQLDQYKWRARGKVPGTPVGLEITHDYVKVASEVVSTQDPEGPAKLQKLLNEWLAATAWGTPPPPPLEASPPAAAPEVPARAEDLAPHFRVEVNKLGQVLISCYQNKELLETIGLNLPGLTNLISQGLMHKPRSLQVGALHDWIELDGEFFSFGKGQNDAARLEATLNARYRSTAALGRGREVVVFANAASPTGFDILFAAKVGGVIDHRRRPLNEQSLGLLQDYDRCGLLPKDMVIKLSPPNFIFKRKTPDGGERYLDEGPESLVTVTGPRGEITMVDLSRPVNYSRLTAPELTAVFNHPAVNQHSQASIERGAPSLKPELEPMAASPAAPAAPPPPPAPVAAPSSPVESKPAPVPGPQRDAAPAPAKPADARPASEPAPAAAPAAAPPPNLWLQEILRHTPIRRDWFNWLIYRRMAEFFGNSNEGYFGPIPCWACSLNEAEDICDPDFRGIFLTQKGGLGYFNQGRIIRFCNDVVFIGTLETAIEGIRVPLVAVGADSQCRLVFIVREGYRDQFGIPGPSLAGELELLREQGALLMSIKEVLHSPEPIEVAWTVPSQQDDPANPQAMEYLRPGAEAEAEDREAPPADADGLMPPPPGAD